LNQRELTLKIAFKEFYQNQLKIILLVMSS
jgi:hypothetical protein